MESPGEYLKRERELRGVSINHIFEATRVPMKYLEALESDNYDSMPHPTFVKGFIKSYCKCLGLDENDSVLRYEIYLKERAEKTDKEDRPHIPRPMPPVRKKAEQDVQDRPGQAAQSTRNRIAAFIAIGFVIAVSVYFVSFRHRPQPATSEARKADALEVQEKPAERIQPLQQAQAGPRQEEPIPAMQAEAPKPAPLKPRGQEKKAPAAQAIEKKQAAVPSRGANPASNPAGGGAVKTAEADAGKNMDSVQGPEKKHVLAVDAREVSWIKLQIDGAEPFDVLLKEGEHAAWKASSNFEVVVGNAGGVNITYDGAKLGPLGASGEVVSLQFP